MVLMKRKASVLTFTVTLLVLFLIVASAPSLKAASEPSPVPWDKTYGPIEGYRIMQTDDGGYAIACEEGVWHTSRGPGGFTNVTFLLIKTDSAGQVQWRKNYQGAGLYSAILTNDGGYALVGIDNGERNLVKVDSEGNVQWSKNYSALSDSFPSDVVQTQDGGYAIAGYASSGYGSESRLVKIDANGNLQWNKTYGAASEYNSVYSLVEAEDGGFAMAGITGYHSHGDLDAWLVKTDSQGTVIWNVAYGTTGRDSFRSVAQTTDGEYVAAGEFNFLVEYSAATVVVKIDALGNVKWAIKYQNRRSNPLSIIGTQDGGYAFTGEKALGRYTDFTDIWFVKNTPPSDFQRTLSGFYATSAPAEPPETFPITWIVIATVTVVAGLSLGLLAYLIKKRKR